MMANKTRLIDANALLEKFQFRLPISDHIAESIDECVKMARRIIKDAPTVDAVEVVRCKGCKQWVRNSGVAESPNGHCFYHDIESNGCDFCSYGERKEAP